VRFETSHCGSPERTRDGAIVGELKGLGIAVSATTVRAWLRAAGLGPVGKRREMTWREFVRAHRQSLLAVDFFTRDDLAATALRPLLHRVGQPSCACGGLHTQSECGLGHPAGAPVVVALAERSEPLQSLIRDRDQKFTDGFDDVFRSDGIAVVRTPARAPQANGVAERIERTVRTECLNRLLVLNQPHLERILEVFVDHYYRHRPHRALSLAPPEARRSVASSSALGDARILRRDRLGGVIHEYSVAA
jgi:putative transposase